MSMRLWFGLALVTTALLTGCSGDSAQDAPPALALTAEQRPALVPAADTVSTALDVASVDSRANEAVSQALEGVELPAGLEWYGHGFVTGAPNSGSDWSAVSVLLILASSASDAERLLDDLTSAGSWPDADIDDTSAARTQHFGPIDGFTGDRVIARSGSFLIDLTAFGSADVTRAATAQELVTGILERAAQANP